MPLKLVAEAGRLSHPRRRFARAGYLGLDSSYWSFEPTDKIVHHQTAVLSPVLSLFFRALRPLVCHDPVETSTMAPSRNAQSTSAELSLVPLKNCLVNLPPTLVSLLVNINTVSFAVLRVWIALTVSKACAECHCRAQLPRAAERATRGRKQPAIRLRGMDGHAQQKEVCSPRWARRRKWLPRSLTRSGDASGRDRSDIGWHIESV